MKQLLLENLKPGMVLANDVFDRMGRPILKAGVTLTAGHITTFKTWRIASVSIESAAEVTTSPASVLQPAAKLKLDGRFKQLFRNTDLTHPFTQQLYSYAVQRAARLELRARVRA